MVRTGAVTTVSVKSVEVTAPPSAALDAGRGRGRDLRDVDRVRARGQVHLAAHVRGDAAGAEGLDVLVDQPDGRDEVAALAVRAVRVDALLERALVEPAAADALEERAAELALGLVGLPHGARLALGLALGDLDVHLVRVALETVERGLRVVGLRPDRGDLGDREIPEVADLGGVVGAVGQRLAVHARVVAARARGVGAAALDELGLVDALVELDELGLARLVLGAERGLRGGERGAVLVGRVGARLELGPRRLARFDGGRHLVEQRRAALGELLQQGLVRHSPAPFGSRCAPGGRVFGLPE
jgi:hypothetical protein